MARYYIIAGESSGDMHGANLMKRMQERDKGAHFRFWGGERMKSVAGSPVKHIRDLAFMGFFEVVSNLRTIWRNIAFCKKDILAYDPHVLILIDYPGFNMRMARFAKKRGIQVVYYISPQVWAWKQSRVNNLKRDVDTMIVILPFEREFYARFGMQVHFAGHPLLDEIKPLTKSAGYQSFRKDHLLPGKPLVALLPGSRKQEIRKMLRIMTAMAPLFVDYQFVVAGVSSYDKKLYLPYTDYENVSVLFDQTYPLLANATAALVASGTATLETALFNVPQAVCYKANPISYYIARRLIRVNHISLVNLVLNREVVQELIQDSLDKDTLHKELDRLLHDTSYRTQMQQHYRQLEEKLGGPGASDNAARIITDVAQRQS